MFIYENCEFANNFHSNLSSSSLTTTTVLETPTIQARFVTFAYLPTGSSLFFPSFYISQQIVEIDKDLINDRF